MVAVIMDTLLSLLIVASGLFISRNEARPASSPSVVASSWVPSAERRIINGTDALPGAWPWQLSHEMYNPVSGWSHVCGACLLSANRALSAAHCVIGSVASNSLVKAGLTDRQNDMPYAQLSVVSGYTLHERYQQDPAHFSNDLAILYLTTAITPDDRVQYLTLPADNSNNFAGLTCVITGWGRTSSATNDMAVKLQQASMTVLTTEECAGRLQPATSWTISDNNVCVFDDGKGTCNGDSGGPLNCPDGTGGYNVVGVVSWSVHVTDELGQDNCIKSYPSVYTRTSTYIDWINSH